MTLTPQRGELGAIYLASGSNNEYSDEAMSNVDLTADGYAAYTVYEITSATKRYMNDDEVPTFEADTAGNGTFVAITPAEIQYCGGRIILSTARGSTDVVRCATGHYLTVTQFLGALNWSLSQSWKTEAYMHLGDSCQSEALVHKQWEATTEAHWMATQATYTTTGGNANSHITMTHEPGGDDGNNVSIELDDPGTTSSLLVSVVGKDIVVTLAYATGAITTTATQLAAALCVPAVLALGITAKVKDGETGAGIVADLAHTHLAGGLDPENYGESSDKVVVVLYTNSTNDSRYEGFGVIQKFNPKLESGALIKSDLTFKNYGPSKLYWRGS